MIHTVRALLLMNRHMCRAVLNHTQQSRANQAYVLAYSSIGVRSIQKRHKAISYVCYIYQLYVLQRSNLLAAAQISHNMPIPYCLNSKYGRNPSC